MKLISPIYIFIFLTVSSYSTASDYQFNQPEREGVIKDSLQALISTPKAELSNTYKFLKVVSKNQCISAVKQLEIQCLIEAAHRNCETFKSIHRKRCKLYSDIALSVLFEEKRVITRSIKSKLSKMDNDSLPKAIFEEVQRHLSIITLDWLASPFWNCDTPNMGCYARSIHRYCDHYTNSKNGSWQGCVAGLSFNIGLNYKDN